MLCVDENHHHQHYNEAPDIQRSGPDTTTTTMCWQKRGKKDEEDERRGQERRENLLGKSFRYVSSLFFLADGIEGFILNGTKAIIFNLLVNIC